VLGRNAGFAAHAWLILIVGRAGAGKSTAAAELAAYVASRGAAPLRAGVSPGSAATWEMWVWDRDAGLRVFALRDGDYEPAKSSRFFPDLDVAWFATFLDQPTQSQAVRALRTALRAAE
jgi:hypothetical protein